MSYFSSFFTLPSLPTLPRSYLPSFPSLPQNLQRRFLSYVLKKSFGHLVKDGALDPERIEAQVVTGHVEVKGVELDESAINDRIPLSVPLRLESGSLGTLTADLGSGPLSRAQTTSSSQPSSSYSLNLALTHLHLNLVFDPTRRSNSTDGSQHAEGEAMVDLASSVLSVADDFVSSELDAQEERDLLASVRTLRKDQSSDPFISPEVEDEDKDMWLPPGSMKPFINRRAAGEEGSGGTKAPDAEGAKTLVMGFVEGMLARLKVNVKDVRVKVRFASLGLDGDSDDGVEEESVELELRMSGISYQDEATSTTSTEGTSRSKVLRFSSFSVAMLQRPTMPPSSPSTPMLRASTSTLNPSPGLHHSTVSDDSSASSSSSNGDPNSTLMMSQAIADLRHSTLEESTQSLYESATEDGPSASFRPPSPKVEDLDSFQPTDTPQAELPEELWRTLLSMGEEDVVLRFSPFSASVPPSTSRPQAPGMQRTPSFSSDIGGRMTSRLSIGNLQGPSISLSVPAVTLLVLPDQVRSLSNTVTLLLNTRPSPPTPAKREKPVETARSITPHNLLDIRSVLLIAVYSDEDVPPSALDSFWSAKSKGGHLQAGHLACKVGRIELYSNPNASATDTHPHRSTPRKSTLSRSPSSLGGSNPHKETPPSAGDLIVAVESFSVFEHLSAALVASSAIAGDPSPAVAPIVLVDPDLPNQYEFGEAGAFPEFESQDWRSGSRARKAGAVEKAWRVRVGRATKFAASAGEASPVDVGPALRATRISLPGHGLSINLLPLHFFLDLALVERLLPWLRIITPVRRHQDDSIDKPTQGTTSPVVPRDGLGVLDSLEAEYSDDHRGDAVSPSSSSNIVQAPFIRLDLRCPARTSSQGIGDGSFMRSGIFTLNIHQVAVQLSSSSPDDIRPRSGAPPPPTMQLEWRQLGLFFLRVSETRARAFLAIGVSLAANSHDSSNDGPPLLPRIQLFPSERTTPSSTLSSFKAAPADPQHIKCRFPSIQADVHKATAEGLQYFVDDITQWLNGAFGDGSRPCPKEDIKLIGSRFFGTKYSSVSSSSSEEGSSPLQGATAGGKSSAGMATVEISDIDITLRAPRTSAAGDPPRVMQLWAAETIVTLDSSVHLKKESILCVAVGDLKFQDVSHAEAPVSIVERTSHRGLESRPRATLSVQLASAAELDLSGRTTDVEVSVFNCTFFGSADFSWVSDLADFAKPPEGAFEDVEPSDITRISVHLDETSLHMLAPTLSGALVLNMQDLLLSTELINDAPSKAVGLSATAVYLLLTNDTHAPAPEPKSKPAPPSPVGHWKGLGYAHILQATTIKAIIDILDYDPQVKVDIIRLKLQLQACPDSLTTFGAIVGDLAKVLARSPRAETQSESTASSVPDQPSDMMGSIEEQAFLLQPTLVDDADLLRDDIPRNNEYLASQERGGKHKRPPEPLSAFETVNLDDTPNLESQVISETDGETIKLFQPQGVTAVENFVQDYTSRPPSTPDQPPSLKLRVRDCDVSILLHDGFDWHSTQKAIEMEVKSVRRRLEKIRQLLASGQTPDESVEQTSTTLFNSVYIGLPRYPTDADASAYLATLGDDDLLNIDFADDTSQTTSFQSVKGRPGGSSTLPPKTKSKRKRLTRSKHARIIINLYQLRVALETSSPPSSIASSLRVTVRDLEILDQIKSSTWKKFLTEMRVDSHGNTREADSHMVTIELLNVRPAEESSREEGLLRAKILPLRLHVDQDALDFLKRFFSFKDPKAASAQADEHAGGKEEVYLQHVEIFPIQLKLDYKPKRVDYKGLREGKTIELMNFFHFDGAEMTLRRITLSGVTGWARLFDTLNVLWTPDVKANQLADIITSIAPIRSLVNVGSGVADLVLLPLEQYGKDRRIVRGVQRGATAFVKSTAIEAIKLGAGLATGTQVVLERAEAVLGGGRSDRFSTTLTGEALGGPALDDLHSSSDDERDEHVSRYAKQPADVKEGVSTAYKSLSKNFNSAAETILAVPMEVYEKSGTDGPVRAVVRAIPIAILKPMIGASEAVSKTLFGLRNTIDPSARRDLEDKYK